MRWAGHVPILISGTGLVAPAVAEGAAGMLTVTGAERSPGFPAVPTVTESGHPGIGRSEWYGLVGPAGLPPVITARMNAAILEALRQRRSRSTGNWT